MDIENDTCIINTYILFSSFNQYIKLEKPFEKGNMKDKVINKYDK